jgi:hypothetical protein
MIRPLRRRHRWITGALFAIVVIVMALAWTHRAPSAAVDSLPSEIR